jgi:DNA (cytosine-5)-methyltransferase 1
MPCGGGRIGRARLRAKAAHFRQNPRALDLFCGAGGASMGLYRAGFDVTGVDIKPQPRYPFRFVQADALQPPFRLSDFDFIWASPPCQAFTRAQRIHGRAHPDLLTPTRRMLQVGGASWVIENVPGAPMRASYVLCGSQFGERRLKRHRWFECSWPAFDLLPSCNHMDGNLVSVFGHGGHIYHGIADWHRVMGIDWMTRDELAQAIPPAYAEFIGRAALQHVRAAA